MLNIFLLFIDSLGKTLQKTGYLLKFATHSLEAHDFECSFSIYQSSNCFGYILYARTHVRVYKWLFRKCDIVIDKVP